MAQKFQFINPINLDAVSRNSREFSEKSKFNYFVPTTTNISNVDSIVAYYQLYGPLCYYYIDIAGSAPTLNVADGVSATINNLPFGPLSVSGGKVTYHPAPLIACISGGRDMVSRYPYAMLTYATNIPTIALPVPSGTTIDAAHFYISGWFVRD